VAIGVTSRELNSSGQLQKGISMQKDRPESTHVGELRERLRQLRESAGVLARQHRDLSDELAGAVRIASELPPLVEEAPEGGLDESIPATLRSDNFRRQMKQVQDLADELAAHQHRLEQELNLALQEAMELYHSEVAARSELGGEA
jgi:hypothetical protein